MSAVEQRVFQDIIPGGIPVPDLRDDDLHFFCAALDRIAGIALRHSKRDMVATRLRSRLAATGNATYSDYRIFLERQPASHQEWQHFINTLTTNKTEFFREARHFDYLAAEIIPAWLKTGAGSFKAWSAAASTGEEAYTLAMVLSRLLPGDRSFEILATDIDTDVLSSGRNGVYPSHRLAEIPGPYQQTCLDQGRGAVEGWFRIRRALKDRVKFARHNLMETPPAVWGAFDMILCRNVFIYFAPGSMESCVRKLHEATRTGGHLLIGHSESFQGISHSWSMVGPSVFQKASG